MPQIGIFLFQYVVALSFAAQVVRKGRFALILLADQHEVPYLQLLQHTLTVVHAVRMLQYPMLFDCSIASADIMIILLGQLKGP